MVSHWDREARRVVNRSVNACLAPACSIDGTSHVLDSYTSCLVCFLVLGNLFMLLYLFLFEGPGCHVITVEGLGSTRTTLHPVQARLAEFHGAYRQSVRTNVSSI